MLECSSVITFCFIGLWSQTKYMTSADSIIGLYLFEDDNGASGTLTCCLMMVRDFMTR